MQGTSGSTVSKLHIEIETLFGISRCWVTIRNRIRHTYPTLRNNISGPEIGFPGLISARNGKASKSALRPGFGRPEGHF